MWQSEPLVTILQGLPTKGTTTPCQSRPVIDGHEGYTHITQSLRTEASPPVCSVGTYPGHIIDIRE